MFECFVFSNGYLWAGPESALDGGIYLPVCCHLAWNPIFIRSWLLHDERQLWHLPEQSFSTLVTLRMPTHKQLKFDYYESFRISEFYILFILEFYAVQIRIEKSRNHLKIWTQSQSSCLLSCVALLDRVLMFVSAECTRKLEIFSCCSVY